MNYIDLSHNINSKMPVYPGDKEVSLLKEKELSRDYYTAYVLSTGLHVGTHVDCPMHLVSSEITISEYGLEHFAGNGVLISAEEIEEIGYKASYDKLINKGDIVLIYTGMDKIYGSDDYYIKHPYITKELAEFFVNKEIKMLGVDMPSPDFPPFEIHKLLLGNGIFIIENLRNLDKLKSVQCFEVFAQPLKIEAEASLIRAFARY
jgi:kynurenine formamidase